MRIDTTLAPTLEAMPGSLPKGSGEGADVASNDRFVVAILGTPYWTDPSLESLHRREGKASAFLEAVERWGADAFRRCFGAFAAIIEDKTRCIRIAGIDRVGQYRMFYMLYEGGYVFSSRLERLASLQNFTRELDPISLQNYLFYYIVPSPRTIYKHVVKLLPGHYVIAQGDSARLVRYWSMPWGNTKCDADKLRNEVRDRLRCSVERCVSRAGDSEIGSFLSGGLDSSTITGLAAVLQPGLKSFTIRFHERQYDEGEYARLAARRYGTKHYERFILPEEVAPVMEKIASFTDEPYGNSSAIAAYYCAAAARAKGISTMLAGDGGDEIFAGNERYLTVRRYDRYGRIPLYLRKLIFDPLLRPVWLDSISFFGRAHRLMRRYYMSIPQRMYASYHPFQHFTPESVAGPALRDSFSKHKPEECAEFFFWENPNGDEIQRMLALDLQITIADNDLVKVNNACALAGISVLYPMLDDDLLELAAKIPGDLLLRGGELRGFFKDCFSDLLPREILLKKKHGFGLPFQTWVDRDPELRSLLLDNLESMRQRGLFSQSYVDALQRAILSNEDSALRSNAWDMVMLELWLRDRRLSVG